jgi:hypothetical protein
MDMKICKHVHNSLKYWKLNLDHYTYMEGNGMIPLHIQLWLKSSVFSNKISKVYCSLNLHHVSKQY